MRWWLCATLLLCLALLAESMAQQQKTKRRKMRKRKIGTSTLATSANDEKVTEAAPQDSEAEEVEEAGLEPVKQEERNARG